MLNNTCKANNSKKRFARIGLIFVTTIVIVATIFLSGLNLINNFSKDSSSSEILAQAEEVRDTQESQKEINDDFVAKAYAKYPETFPRSEEFTLEDKEYNEGEIIVKAYESGLDLDKVKEITGLEDLEVESDSYGVIVLKSEVLTNYNDDQFVEILKTLDKSEAMEYAEPNYIFKASVVNDTFYASHQWGLENTGQNIQGQVGTPDVDIDAEEGWKVNTGSSEVVIKILDTGIDTNHPDLMDKIVDTRSYVPWELSVEDYNFHGSHVAGISAASSDNNKGIAGVCRECSIASIKVLASNGYGTASTVTNGLFYAVDSYSGTEVINMSLGSSANSITMYSVIQDLDSLGVPMVAAAGNSNNSVKNYPAAYDEVISVGGVDNQGNKYSESSYGDWVDIAAPGTDIYSALTTLVYPNYPYWYISGTSMAAPHVAGAIGLLLSEDIILSNSEIKEILQTTAEPGPANLGAGVLNLGKAMQEVEVTNQPPVANQDSIDLYEKETNKEFDFNSAYSDPDGDNLTVNISESELQKLTQAGISYNTNNLVSGKISLTAPWQVTTTQTITLTYTVSDGEFSVDSTIIVTLLPVNDTPIAVDDSFETPYETPLTITQAEILVNDSDPDGDKIFVSSFTNPKSGKLVLDFAGNFIYTPDNGFFGQDSFTYTISDGNGGQAIATVFINVNKKPNQTPVVEDLTKSQNENTTATYTLLASDLDGDALTYELVDTSEFDNLGVSYNLNSNTGEITVNTPEVTTDTTVKLTFRVNDGTVNSNVATFRLTVINLNKAPEANPAEFSLFEKETNKEFDFNSAYSDPDGDNLTVNISESELQKLTQAGISYNTNNLVSGKISLTAPWQVTTTQTITLTYTVSDGEFSVDSTIIVTLLPVNDTPIAVDDSFETPYETPLTITQAEILVNDSDPDGDKIFVSSFTNPKSGKLVLDFAGNFIYTPDNGFFGQDSFTYTISDGNGGQAIATVFINVNKKPNQTPVVEDLTKSQNENTTATYTLLASDLDGDALTYELVDTSEFDNLGVSYNLNSNTGEITVNTPEVTTDTTVKLTFRVNDGTVNSNVATFRLTVINLNTNTPPDIDIKSPFFGQEFAYSAQIPLLTEVTDNGKVTRVEVYIDNNLVKEFTSGPYALDLRSLINPDLAISTTYNLKIVAYDNEGAKSQANTTFIVKAKSQVEITDSQLSPVLECVFYNSDGTHTALFGYNNTNTVNINITAGSFENRFDLIKEARNQPSVFQPGRQYGVFMEDLEITIDNPFGTLVWTLTGPDGKTRTSTASIKADKSNQCGFSRDDYLVVNPNTKYEAINP